MYENIQPNNASELIKTHESTNLLWCDCYEVPWQAFPRIVIDTNNECQQMAKALHMPFYTITSLDMISDVRITEDLDIIVVNLDALSEQDRAQAIRMLKDKLTQVHVQALSQKLSASNQLSEFEKFIEMALQHSECLMCCETGSGKATYLTEDMLQAKQNRTNNEK